MDALIATVRAKLEAEQIAYTLTSGAQLEIGVSDLTATREVFNTMKWVRTRSHCKESGVWIARATNALVPVVVTASKQKVDQKFRTANRGLIVSFIGPDGSGKSTLVEAIRAWLGPFHQTDFYLGHGDPITSAWKSLAVVKNKMLRRPMGNLTPVESKSKPPEKVRRDSVRETVRDAADVARGLRKRGELKRMVDLRRRGEVAITDRFPHHEIFLVDGPAIRHKPPGPMLRPFLDRAERSVFRPFESLQPDIVFKLRIDPEIAWARKRENTLQEIKDKVDAVDQVEFRNAHVVEVNAEAPLEDVIAAIKDEIWDLLATHPRRLEFVGAPASGKTTVSDLVSDQLALQTMVRPERQEKLADHHRTQNRRQRYISFAGFVKEQAKVVRFAFGFSLSVRPINRGSQHRAVMLLRETENTDIWNTRRSNQADLEIHEQQLLQELFSITFLRSHFSQSLLESLLDAIRPYSADLIVFIDVPAKVILQRMDARLLSDGPLGEIDRLRSKGELTEFQLSEWLLVLRRILKTAAEKGMDILTVDGLASAEEQAALIINEIKRRRDG